MAFVVGVFKIQWIVGVMVGQFLAPLCVDLREYFEIEQSKDYRLVDEIFFDQTINIFLRFHYF